MLKKLTRNVATTYRTIAAVIMFSWLTTGIAWGQEPAASNDKSGWFMGYALVVLAICLGLMAVCRPGARTTDIKIDHDDDDE